MDYSTSDLDPEKASFLQRCRRLGPWREGAVRLNPVPLTLRQKKLVRISSGVMAMSGVLFLIIGVAKGLVAAYGLGAAALLVAGANAWLCIRLRYVPGEVRLLRQA